MELQCLVVLQMVGRLRGGSQPLPVFVAGSMDVHSVWCEVLSVLGSQAARKFCRCLQAGGWVRSTEGQGASGKPSANHVPVFPTFSPAQPAPAP